MTAATSARYPFTPTQDANGVPTVCHVCGRRAHGIGAGDFRADRRGNVEPRWQSIKRAILKRDNYRCQECGCGGQLHVHHQVPFRMFDDPEQANHEDNLISLCPTCHRIEDARSKWVKVGDCIIQMSAGSYAWELARKLIANDNRNKVEAA